MKEKEIFQYIKDTDNVPPFESASYEDWINAEDVIRFLKSTKELGLIPTQIYSKKFFMYSLFIPKVRFENMNPEYLMNLSLQTKEQCFSFSLWSSAGKEWVKVCYPFDDDSDEFFKNAEPVLYYRSFLRGPEERPYSLEFSQKLIHASNAYWVDKQNSFCKLDYNGDYVDLFKIKKQDNITIAFADLTKLRLYCFFTNTKLVRLFVVDRFDDDFNFLNNESRKESKFEDFDEQIFFKKLTLQNSAGKSRFCQIRGANVIEDNLTVEDAIRLLYNGENKVNKYEKFIAFDRKNNVVKEISCAPEALSNYFTKSDLPFETTPAFFKPEVLIKYKNDPEKYEITDRTIRCRGAWSLKTYDINEEGQVHTYLCYLRDIPFSEQLYWKSFNEPPKSGLSKRAITTDFEGKWWMGNDPLRDLKNCIKKFPLIEIDDISISLFKSDIKGFNEKVDELHYVVTESREEFKTEIIKLASVVIDAFSKDEIRKLARKIGCDDPQLGSIKLLANCLSSIRALLC
ncbi:conserved hypothetical protein [Candidatus Brocadia pituitae]|nr:conserved hypothetical protein [Candidatus Brocadia pituitae]